MVGVVGGAHLWSGVMGSGKVPLGLAQDSITVAPTFFHDDVKVDDFGPHVPADVQQQLAWVDVSMTLVHADYDVMDVCWNESLGGGMPPDSVVTARVAGAYMAPTGRLLSRFRNRLWSGWHYIGLNLSSPELRTPWRFYQSYLTGQPVRYPMGTEVAAVQLNWRCIPYCQPWLSGGTAGTSGAITVDGQVYFPRRQMQSSGIAIWDRTGDADAPEPEQVPEDLPEG